jgi:hypothetical protein
VYLIGQEMTADATKAWQYCVKAGFGDDILAGAYVDGLVRAKHFEQARIEWVRYLGAKRVEMKSRIFNGGFETDPLPTVMDWHFESTEDAAVSRGGEAHDGQEALQIQYSGKANVSAVSAEQKMPVESGRHLLRAWVRSEGITTNEGPRLELSDVESSARLSVRTEPIVGTRAWSQLIQPVMVPSATRFVTLRLVREPSQKFDNKIAGTFWLDSVELIRQ